MPLCGFRGCGCAVATLETTSGSISGAFPDIQVPVGSGDVADPFQFLLNPAWAAAAATFSAGNTTAWTSYVPTLVQGVAVTKTIQFAEYQLSGPALKTVSCQFSMTATSAGTAAAPVVVGLPVSSFFGSPLTPGMIDVYDVSATTKYQCVGELTTVIASFLINDLSAGSAFGAAPAVTLAAGDIISGWFMYEAA